MKIRVEGASFHYPDGTEALREVDLVLESGATVALAGRNGAGKTTLARLLNGLLVPQEGRVLVGDLETGSVPASLVAGRVGYVFQNPRRQVFAATVGEEAAFGPRNLGWPEEEVEEAVGEALAAVGLDGREDRHPYELSLGELRRLALASVLSMRTPVVVLDEPTASLDGPDHRRLLQVLAGLRRRGATVVAITHDMEFASEEFDRLVCLHEGRVVADGPAGEVFGRGVPPGLQLPSAGRLAERLGLPRRLCRGSDLLEALASRGEGSG